MRPVGVELFREDGRRDGRTGGQTDMTKLIVAFRNFANPPKITVLQKCDNHCNDVAMFVWWPVRVIAMATAKRNYELKLTNTYLIFLYPVQ